MTFELTKLSQNVLQVTPAAYGHMVHSLMSFADGKVGVFLEGGYFIESLAEGVAMSLRALLGYPCLSLGSLAPPDDSVVSTNLDAISMLRKPWNCLNLQDEFCIKTYDVMREIDCHVPALIFKGENLGIEDGEDYGVNDEKTIAKAKEIMEVLRTKYALGFKRLKLSENVPVALVYDEEMMKHSNVEEPSHPEQPLRIKQIFETIQNYGLLDRVSHLPTRKATKEELNLLHDKEHIDAMEAIEEMGQDQREKKGDSYDSIYFNEYSYNSALLAAGNLLNVVDAVCSEEAQSGKFFIFTFYLQVVSCKLDTKYVVKRFKSVKKI